MQSNATPSSRSRQAGFSFIEILVVMAIIGLLAGMVAALVPWVQENARQTKSKQNVKSLVTFMLGRRTGKVSGGWPRYNGKNFTLSVIATKDLDIRRKENLEILFSPGDQELILDDTDLKRYEDINKKSLKDGDFHELTSYAGRRNDESEHRINSDDESKGALIICDDDFGGLHHPDGLICGYTGGDVRFKDWEEFDMVQPDPRNPDEFLGDAASHEDLQHMLGH